MTDEEYIPYPGVEPEKKKTIEDGVSQASEGTWFKEQPMGTSDTVNDENGIEAKRARLQEKRERAYERADEKAIDKELKRLEYEEKHPTRVSLRKRSKAIGKGVKRQVEGAWRSTKQVGHEVKVQRMKRGQYPYGAPKVLPRPRGMRMTPPPSARSNVSREEAVSSTMERDFFGTGQQQQEKDFFGPSKLLDLIGGGNEPKKEIDYIGNKNKKKNVRYY